MEEQQAATVSETPSEAAPPKEQHSRKKPKRLPPYAVIVLNDDLHSFDYVIETFMKVFGYNQQKSFLLAQQIHLNGRGIVWSGPKEVAELKRDQILGAGPDLYAAKKVEGPLGAFIEPLPG
jgi:ATP-dependent Clp protease adaptor protein ClpS